jgi:phage tail-like protein
MAPPGRYLWVVLGLSGTGRATPRVATLSVERPGHRLLDALPRRWSRSAIEADFLQRFLAPAEGVLHGLDQLASRRHSLVDPSAAPERSLDWLASLVGFVLDRRWPAAVQREFIAAAYDLFRIRGTQACLERALKIYLRRNVPVIERWRLAGLGGVVLASDRGGQTTDLPPRIASAQSGSAALGSFTIDADAGGTGAAHRFSVLVPMALDDEQREAVRAIVERFKPAHTAYDICELGDGMHVGSGLLVDLTSVVGPGADWVPLVVGDTPIGIDALLGLPYPGARVGETALIGAGCGEGVQVG